MNKIVYIKYSPITKKIYEDYCMAALLECGYEVEYWDMTNIFGFKFDSIERFNPHNNLGVVTLNSYDELDAYLYNNKESFFISMMTCSIRQAHLLRLLTKHRCRIAFWGPDPVFIPQKNLVNKIHSISLKKIKTKLGVELMKLLFKTKALHYYDYYFNVGNLGYKALGVVDNKLLNHSIPIDINSSDYSKYNFTNYNKILNDKYIVFIDQYFPFHPDFIICGARSIPAEAYYNSLNKYFAFIEEKLNMKVVIAAHPKSLRYREHNYFNGRDIYFGLTCPLVKYSSFVLAHNSTAVNYALMSNKPIFLLSSSTIMQYLPNTVMSMKYFANRFSIPFVDMDDKHSICEINFSGISKAQSMLYESFVNEYCTSPHLTEPNEKIVADFFNKEFGKNGESVII